MESYTSIVMMVLKNLHNNISPMATRFQLHFNLSSHKISVSSHSSLMNMNLVDQKHDKFQLYQDSTNRLLVEPQTSGASDHCSAPSLEENPRKKSFPRETYCLKIEVRDGYNAGVSK